ncbi:MAG TPA: membrane protein insertion efficiency factor YidD [Roseimicrobium sp.]|nr:membrane protein insertion efficiency factor YidD [Roseimicrobium sp.]
MNPGQHVVLGVLWLYRRGVSPVLHTLFGPMGGCRFTPTCSQYAIEAVQRHGVLRGSGLAATRLCRCHPWGGCGHDPVPQQQLRPLSTHSSTTGSLPPVEPVNG